MYKNNSVGTAGELNISFDGDITNRSNELYRNTENFINTLAVYHIGTFEMKFC